MALCCNSRKKLIWLRNIKLFMLQCFCSIIAISSLTAICCSVFCCMNLKAITNSLLFQNIATFFLLNCYKRLVFAIAMHGRNQWLCVILALYLF